MEQMLFHLKNFVLKFLNGVRNVLKFCLESFDNKVKETSLWIKLLMISLPKKNKKINADVIIAMCQVKTK